MRKVTLCLVCQGPLLEDKFKTKSHLIARCSDCGFCLVVDPPNDSQLEEIYERLHLSHQKFRDERAAARENLSRLLFVKNHLAMGSTLLDAGCATGDFLHEARQHFDVSGMDISQGAVESAQSRFPELQEKLKCGRLERNPFGDHRFDAICLWDVIEHVRDPVQITDDLLSILKPGGYLFLSTPDIGSFTARLMGRHWAFMIPPLHLGYLSRASAKRMLEARSGNKVLEIKTRGKWTSVAFLFYKLGQIHPWMAPAWLMRWLGGSAIGRVNIYVPTNDIMYLAVRKPGLTY